MPYIGVAPSSGLFKKLDSISTVNNQAAYTMQYNSSDFKPATAEQLIVSLNGVIQAPNDAYTVSGSTITFSENLVTGDVIDFIVALGEVGNAVTPVDGSVDINKMSSSLMTESGGETTLKIDNIQNSSGTSAISIDDNGVVTYPKKPAFAARLDTTTTVTDNVWVKVPFDVEEFDLNSDFDLTNDRFTAPVDGIYHFSGYINYLNIFAVDKKGYMAFKKNGTQYYYSFGIGVNGEDLEGDLTLNSSITLKLTAGDYIELWCYQDSASTAQIRGGSQRTRFSGFLVA